MKLLNKYLAGDALPEEKREVVRWMKESEEHREQLMQMRHIYDATIWNGNLQEKKAENKKIMMRYLWASMKIAAVIAMIAFIIHKEYQEYRFEHSTEMQMMTVPAGQRASLVLADGTIVWLNSNSTLKYPATGFHAKERKVILEGEGYFEVAHNEKHPFIVETEKYDIRVLGTTFNVSAYPNSGLFEASLIEGKVKVHTAYEDMTLYPKDKAVLENGLLTRKQIDDMDTYRWRDGLYCFKNLSFDDVLKQFEIYYDIRFVKENPQIANPKLNGKFRLIDGVDYALRVLQREVGFSFRRDDEANVIYLK